jgi:Fuc2NAc and GlcNAc transferase
MVPALPIAWLAGSFLASLVLLTGILRLSVRLRLVATPNERSSHRDERPTIGGIAIVLPALVVLAAAAVDGDRSALGMMVAGGGLAVIGLLDDVRELGALPRFVCQMLAVVLLMWCMALPVQPVLWLVIAFALLWHVNLFNFMDGIDGIAGAQTLIFCVGVQMLGGGLSGNAGNLDWVLAGATLGFLAFNWPPARIFMGDVGALFLGLVIGALVIELHRTGQVPFIASIILLTGFWFDASYTLCVRMITHQAFVQAHRSHLYQRVADRIGHLGSTLLFCLVGLMWLLPLAWLSVRYPAWAIPSALLAALPYLTGAILLHAGRACAVKDRPRW